MYASKVRTCHRVSLATMSTTSEFSSVRGRPPRGSQYGGGGGRRMSRVTDDEFDEMAFMQQQVSIVQGLTKRWDLGCVNAAGKAIQKW